MCKGLLLRVCLFAPIVLIACGAAPGTGGSGTSPTSGPSVTSITARTDRPRATSGASPAARSTASHGATGTAATAEPVPTPRKLPSTSKPPVDTPAVRPTGQAVKSTAVPASTATLSTPKGWKTYRNDRAGYSVDYPASWAVHESAPARDLSTTFTSPRAREAIGVTVIEGGRGDAGNSDIPNTRCGPVTISGLSGTQCFDTISFSISTTLAGEGKTYVVSTSAKGMDRRVYDRLLRSFRVAEGNREPGATAPPEAGAAIRFVRVAGYDLAVAGKGWGGRTRLVFKVQPGSVQVLPPPEPRERPLSFRSTGDGGFLVGMMPVDMCAGLTVTVQDSAGHDATLTTPPLRCPPRARPTKPELTVLKAG